MQFEQHPALGRGRPWAVLWVGGAPGPYSGVGAPLGHTLESRSPLGHTLESRSPLGHTLESGSPLGHTLESGSPLGHTLGRGRPWAIPWTCLSQTFGFKPGHGWIFTGYFVGR